MFASRVKSLRVPYNIGRSPNSLADKLEFSNLTANQWKNFTLIYAKPCLWDLLPPEWHTLFSGLDSRTGLADWIHFHAQARKAIEDR